VAEVAVQGGEGLVLLLQGVVVLPSQAVVALCQVSQPEVMYLLLALLAEGPS